MRIASLIFLWLFFYQAGFTQSFTFNRFTTDDGIGLLSNVVHSIYQDEKGFIWVGTANGLQRFDGRKFIKFNSSKPGSDVMPDARVFQIIPLDSGRLFLAYTALREFGIFDPSNFTYKKISLKTSENIPPRAEFHAFKDSYSQLYLNVLGYGILQLNKVEKAFIDNHPFPLPAGWKNTLLGIYEDSIKKQLWFCMDSGLCIYDRRSGEIWTKSNNPQNLSILKNKKIQDKISDIYIDKHRRIWVFGWPKGTAGKQWKYCLDSTGSKFLAKDTMGLNNGPLGYTVYSHFYETKNANLWIYGIGALFNYNEGLQKFQYHKSGSGNDNININYEEVYQVMEDKDEGIWIATDQGLYFTSLGNNAYSVINLMFDNKRSSTYITDILEMPGGDLWFTSWGIGVKTMDKNFVKKENYVYSQPPPASWPLSAKDNIRNTWCMCRQSATGQVWVGCNNGVLLVHDPAKRITQYHLPAEFDNSTVKYITEDNRGQLWFGTEGGRLIKYSDNKFTVVQEIGSTIYKVFADKDGWIWLSTHERGFYAIDPADGKVIQHYSVNNESNSLYSNTGNDIEQLNDSIIVLGAGVLNFINKKTQSVRLVTYADGLPSNTVARLRMDENGFLWIITSNGLCRYNPNNHRITPYNRKDGIILGELAGNADLKLHNGYMMFAGSNAMIMFHPSVYSTNLPPPPVTITDFKIFNEFLPIDSLLQSGEIKLKNDQNSFSIFFASLSYLQRDRLTYYYQMEGLDKEWIKADKSSYVNYSLLPPGKYVFKIFCENIEGQRPKNITEIRIFIHPSFWRTRWFISTLLFFIALIIYGLHDLRVKRLMEVEKLRNRVARDLHDDMGSTLSTINILSAMAKSKMSSDAVRTSEYLTKITDNSQRMMDAMDDIVWSIKPSNDSMQKIIARMREFATNALEPKEIELEFNADELVYDVKLNMEARRDFFLVFKEAVNNAAKYSKATKVDVTVSIYNKTLVLEVKDDGVGFDVAMADNGNGLGNMQKRADAMNGKVIIHSKAGAGTKVMVTIPLNSPQRNL
ncbi:MAG: two-component regulator propeller domain-containing protein [Ferruginibacter sp.]